MTQTLINYPSDTNRVGFLARPASELNASQAALNASIKNLTDAIAAAQATLATLNSAATDPNISSDGSGHLSTIALTTANNSPPSVPVTFPHCFLFDGSTYATASDAALNGWTAQTIAFWMWADDPGAITDNARLVEKGGNDEWTIIINNDFVPGMLAVQALGGVTPLAAFSQDALGNKKSVCDGVWHLIVVTIDSSGVITLYVDNVLQGGPSAATSLPSTSGMLNISQYAGGGGYNFTGAMNEITIWNRVLSSGEMDTLWNGGAGIVGDTSSGPWNSGLELMYHLDQSTGTTFTDSGPNGITSSTISGTVEWVTPGVLAFGDSPTTTVILANLPWHDPDNAGQIYSDGIPSPGNPKQLMVSGG